MSDRTPLLIVEDMRPVARHQRRLLEPLGFDVRHVETLEAALQALLEVQVVVTDWSLTESGGEGEAVVAACRGAGVPVVVCTSDPDRALASPGMDGVPVVYKPLLTTELGAAVLRVIRRKRLGYADRIQSALDAADRDDVDPRHVEALMRVDHSTLDGLSADRFVQLVGECVAEIDLYRANNPDAVVDRTLEEIAESFGLGGRHVVA